MFPECGFGLQQYKTKSGFECMISEQNRDLKFTEYRKAALIYKED